MQLPLSYSNSSFHQSCIKTREQIGESAAYLKKGIVTAGGRTWTSVTASAKNSFDKTKHFLKTDQGIVRFMKVNWKRLLTYTIAWGIIFAGVGLMYGFKATAVPLSIGTGCGLGFGVITGIAAATLFDRLAKKKGENTLWTFLNKGFNSLDANGTRAIAVSICVTVFMATLVVFPYGAGAAIGVAIGNHIATKMTYNVKVSCGQEVKGHLDLGSPLKNRDNLVERFKQLEAQLKEAKKYLPTDSSHQSAEE